MDVKLKTGIAVGIALATVFILFGAGGLLNFGNNTLVLDFNSTGDISSAFSDGGSTNVLLNGGVMTIDTSAGSGREASEGTVVSLHYIGSFEDGTIFDNSFDRDEPVQFILGAGQVIPGMEAGVFGMKAGGERTIIISPDYAYGSDGFGPIGPDAVLIFNVKLLDVTLLSDLPLDTVNTEDDF